MPRRQYNADLQKVIEGFEFLFPVASNTQPAQPVKVTAMITELSDYPKSHEYMIFSGDDAPPYVGAALENMTGTNRKTVYELLDMVAATLTHASGPDKDGDTTMVDSQFEISDSEGEIEDEGYDEDDVYADDHLDEPISQSSLAGQHLATNRSTKGEAFCAAIRSDLKAAKAAGFKIGYQGGLLQGNNCYVSIAVRISKLGLSEEAMQAWQVDPAEYLVLIIQYPFGYQTHDDLQALDSAFVRSHIGMRICAGKRYKPTPQEAISAFTVAKKSGNEKSSSLPGVDDTDNRDALHDIFISKPLADLLEQRLVEVLRYRSSGLEWHGAEALFAHHHSQAGGSVSDDIPDRFFEPEIINKDFPSIVQGDQFTSGTFAKYSLPLLAMQFALRHFVRCTEFCLVCHSKLSEDVEAIKPYVCDSPLCLFQYMALGFGPSIEHEIKSQPYVVDLLVSFCYTSATARKLKDLPNGLALTVPPLEGSQYASNPDIYYNGRHGQQQVGGIQPIKDSKPVSHPVRYNKDMKELLFPDSNKGGCPVTRGQWIVLCIPASQEGYEYHCRIRTTNLYPTITIDEPVPVLCRSMQIAGYNPAPAAAKAPAAPTSSKTWQDATFNIYNQDFEQLDKDSQQTAMCRLMDTIPKIKDMQAFLTKNYPSDLKAWTERIPPSALSLLRWIIASNRACIMEVDGDQQLLEKPKQQERVFGMTGYMQFRFAMGAPDKEQRFRKDVRSVTERLGLKFPTLFAWHGSPLHNWHMIIREGLNFNTVSHGRAYGDGVYHAKEASTSVGYTGGGAYGYAPHSAWPGSVLKVASALALNEIVNAPGEFTSQQPFYVLKQCDWIQTRYLFVAIDKSSEVKLGEEKRPVNEHLQDPSRTPKGISNQNIVIPAAAIKTSTTGHKNKKAVGKDAMKKLKGLGGFLNPVVLDSDNSNAEDDSDDGVSVATDIEDRQILLSDDEANPRDANSGASQTSLYHKSDRNSNKKENTKPKPASTTQKTDFIPGTLDHATLPIMPAPTYATSGTTRRLMKELQQLAALQETTAPVDLGWYLDVAKIENPYQWIVELHSFHTLSIIDKKTKKSGPLPLVAEMKEKKITSVVLELRFGADYPFSPPYIRVIRPRFLSFAQGGGGHIVMGGAMCMELLTNSGWSSVLSMESVLMQVRMAIGSDPPAKLEPSSRQMGDYGTGEAAEGYVRACRTHGWEVPKGFQEVAHGMDNETNGGYGGGLM